ncbi:hypothetical protein, partial [Agrobacterium vitis]
AGRDQQAIRNDRSCEEHAIVGVNWKRPPRAITCHKPRSDKSEQLEDNTPWPEDALKIPYDFGPPIGEQGVGFLESHGLRLQRFCDCLPAVRLDVTDVAAMAAADYLQLGDQSATAASDTSG